MSVPNSSTVVDIIDEIHFADGLMTAVFTLLERVQVADSEPLYAVAHEVGRRIKAVEEHAKALHEQGAPSLHVLADNALPKKHPDPVFQPSLVHSLISSLDAASDRLAALHLMCESIGDAGPRRAFRQLIEDAESGIAGDITVLKKCV